MIPEYFAYLTIPISLFSILLYIRDIFKGTTKPNKVTWFFWGIAPVIGSYISYKSGVPIPFLIATFMSGAGCFLIVLVSLFNKNSYWKTTKFDIACGIISALAIIIWVTTKSGLVSIFFAILADLSAGIPTVVKSWKHSDTETASPYSLGIMNQIITFFMIKNISFLNFAFPLYLIINNTLIILGIKRHQLKKIFY